MTTTDLAMPPMTAHAPQHGSAVLIRTIVISLTAFLTLVDLFATQAILPSLARAYDVSPAAMGLAVNASTMGMAVAGLAVALFSGRIDRRRGILLSLACLAVPTSLLAIAPDLTTFAVLRVIQGLFMSAAFTLTLAYLGEQCSAMDAGGALRRLHRRQRREQSFRSADVGGARRSSRPGGQFLHLRGSQSRRCGAGLFQPRPRRRRGARVMGRSALLAWAEHLRNPPLRACFGVGFFILFAFIGTFTYVNFVLVRAPFAVGMMTLGFIYFVFAPSFVTTLMAGRAIAWFGMRGTILGALALALVGLPLMLSPRLPLVLLGLDRSSASARSWRRPAPRASSAAPRQPIAARRAASISRPISSAGWSAAPCSARSSIGWAGPRASPASRWRSRRRGCSRRGSSSRPRRARGGCDENPGSLPCVRSGACGRRSG